ncbi:hypothetical protein BaRGS_00032544 [Batillaria attramentaria]|uniref:Uncharacterized protein n=1 Tax=Batillaria attramentaria TaxID=370345 RepID=A0ABD0JN91_9CAEN
MRELSAVRHPASQLWEISQAVLTSETGSQAAGYTLPPASERNLHVMADYDYGRWREISKFHSFRDVLQHYTTVKTCEEGIRCSEYIILRESSFSVTSVMILGSLIEYTSNSVFNSDYVRCHVLSLRSQADYDVDQISRANGRVPVSSFCYSVPSTLTTQ